MTEAERRAAFEAAVVDALEVANHLAEVVSRWGARHLIAKKRRAEYTRAVANVRTLHETAVDAAPEGAQS